MLFVVWLSFCAFKLVHAAGAIIWCCSGILFALENIGDPPWIRTLEGVRGVCDPPNYSNMGCANPRYFQDWGNSPVLLRGKQMSLADASWFIVTTVFTVGYGDVRPLTFLGRVATYGSIVFAGIIMDRFVQF